VADLRDYLAEERTLLAWIRTGLAVMAFGFVVARVVFPNAFPLAQSGSAAPPHPLSAWFGMALVAAGVAINLLAAWRHTRVVAALNDGQLAHSGPSREGITLALFLALAGIAMAVWL
jgi:putative membrane protein